MSSYWANFAKTGNPNGKGLPQWAAFQPGSKATMELGDKPGPRPVAEAAKFDLLSRGILYEEVRADRCCDIPCS